MKEIRLPRAKSPGMVRDENVRRLLGLRQSPDIEPGRFQRACDWAYAHGWGLWVAGLATTIGAAVAMGRC